MIPSMTDGTAICDPDLGRHLWLAVNDPDESVRLRASELWEGYGHALNPSEDMKFFLELLGSPFPYDSNLGANALDGI